MDLLYPDEANVKVFLFQFCPSSACNKLITRNITILVRNWSVGSSFVIGRLHMRKHTQTRSDALTLMVLFEPQDEGEYLLEKDDWKRSDMFFEYRLKEGEDLRLKVLAINFMDKTERFQNKGISRLAHLP